MGNLKCWKKWEKNGEAYYFLPESKDLIKFLERPLIPTRDELDVLENKINEMGRLSMISNSFLTMYTNPDDTDDLVELPYGCYRHQWGNGNRPNRLERMDIRNDTYFVNQRLQNEIREDVQKFLQSRPIFADLGVIYKRGILLYGEPGTGKSAFVRHIISEVMPKECHSIWVDTLPNINFMHKFNAMTTLKIFVLEEITTFNENGDAKEILEFLDGELSPKDAIIIGTTNYPQELKKNMADRPSRFDLVMEIKESDAEEAKMFFESFLKRKLTDGEVTLTGLCVAHIKDICLTSLMYNLPLQECYNKVMERRKNFKNNFTHREGVGFNKGNPVARGRDN